VNRPAASTERLLFTAEQERRERDRPPHHAISEQRPYRVMCVLLLDSNAEEPVIPDICVAI
jgi:hypothetical protein